MYKDTYFEWDQAKESMNICKHGVSFKQAQKAFTDRKRIILEDTKHSDERRFFCVGKVENLILTVRFTYRNERIRIFGAAVWRQFKKIYEQKNKI